ncbi:MAG: hypothetical protein M1835_006027 [Candelina submexicana]|nr:MAG: hypothetical protein M1835_006027 [Candelina submexicana]
MPDQSTNVLLPIQETSASFEKGDCTLRITPLSMLQGDPNAGYPTYYHFDTSTWKSVRAIAVQLALGCVGQQQKGGLQHVGEKWTFIQF